MPITEQQNDELKALLAALSTERGALNDRARDFFDQQVARHEQYGARIFISLKQMAWLRDLYVEHVGSLDGLNYPSKGAREDTLGEQPKPKVRTARPMDDDEIPF